MRSSSIRRIPVATFRVPGNAPGRRIVCGRGWRSIESCHASLAINADERYGPPRHWPASSRKSGVVRDVGRRFRTIDASSIGGNSPGERSRLAPHRPVKRDAYRTAGPRSVAGPPDRRGDGRNGARPGGRWFLRGRTPVARKGCRPIWAARPVDGAARRPPLRAWSGPAACP